MYIAATGNVGIGTTIPNSKLSINGSNAPTSRIEIKRNDAGTLYLGSTGERGYIQTPGADPLVFYTNSIERFRIDSSGNVGIGTTSPTAKLDVNGNSKITGKLDVNGNSKLTGTLTVSSNVGIGTTSPSAKLDVNGNSKITGNLEVTQTITANNLILPPGPIAPDYVFEPDYKLPPLDEIAAYVKENRHLPEVPSAKEMEAQGLNMTTQMMTHLKKIEELTLYMIDLKSENNNLKSTNDQLKASNDEMRSLVQDLAARLAAIETARDANPSSPDLLAAGPILAQKRHTCYDNHTKLQQPERPRGNVVTHR